MLSDDEDDRDALADTEDATRPARKTNWNRKGAEMKAVISNRVTKRTSFT